MEIRHSTHPLDASNYSTDRIRSQFLVDNLFQEDKAIYVYAHDDRMVLGGIVPITKPIVLEAQDSFRTDYFLERRELGIVNIGGAGTITVEGQMYELSHRDCLYVGMGAHDVSFASQNPNQPARFYLVSTPSHHAYPTQSVTLDEAEAHDMGTDSESNRRILYRFIHADGIHSCQLMMGMTVLQPNNMWNTMPAHLHDRRMEAYLYFSLPENARVFHFMGRPEETRHIVVRNEEAVISPSWSIHSGVGTSNYTFIWAMAGENYTFSDMDPVAVNDLK